MRIWVKNLDNGEMISATFPRSLCTAAEYVQRYFPEIKNRKIFYKNPSLSENDDEKLKRINCRKIRLV